MLLSASYPLRELPVTMMTSYGANFDVVQVNDENQYPIDFNFTLYDESGNGKYNSIVMTDVELANFDPETNQSAIMYFDFAGH